MPRAIFCWASSRAAAAREFLRTTMTARYVGIG
jgi:hypothetical protein